MWLQALDWFQIPIAKIVRGPDLDIYRVIYLAVPEIELLMEGDWRGNRLATRRMAIAKLVGGLLQGSYISVFGKVPDDSTLRGFYTSSMDALFLLFP